METKDPPIFVILWKNKSRTIYRYWIHFYLCTSTVAS